MDLHNHPSRIPLQRSYCLPHSASSTVELWFLGGLFSGLGDSKDELQVQTKSKGLGLKLWHRELKSKAFSQGKMNLWESVICDDSRILTERLRPPKR